MRNILAHEYLGFNKVIIWETAISHLRLIKITIEQILKLKGED
jgi:uncharacterized protein with HEPN domain